MWALCGWPGYEPVKNLDKNNAQQAIVLEAVALALALDSDAEVPALCQGPVSLPYHLLGSLLLKCSDCG